MEHDEFTPMIARPGLTAAETAILWQVKRYCLDMEERWRRPDLDEIEGDDIFAAGVVAGVRLVALYIGRLTNEVPQPQVNK